jgi:hypothetical protein
VTTAASRRAAGRVWIGLGVALAVVVAVVLASGHDTGERYDLDDAQASGYKGLRLVLEAGGGTVERIDAAALDAELAQRVPVAFVPVAQAASAAAARRGEAYARAGGTLVLGTPQRDTGPQTASGEAFDPGVDIVAIPRGVCDIAALRDARAVDPSGSVALRVPWGAESCYGDGDTALVVRQAVGAGAIVTLASPNLFTNDAMRPHDQDVDHPHAPMRDNVVVASRLLDPVGQGTVAVVTSGVAAVVDGQRQLSDLIGAGVKLGIWQLIAAFVLFAWYRGRRFGRVVVEAQPVPIAGSELVEAVGNLMERRDDPGRAAWVLRRDAAGDLAMRLGVPRSTDVSVVAAMIGARTGRDPAAVLGTLATAPVTSDDELLAVAADLEAIRQEVLHGRHTPA